MYDKIHKIFHLSYELAYEKHGNWSNRSETIVVLIHGIGANQSVWSQTLDLLGDRPSIVVDLLGFGVSHKPDWPHYSLNDHARSLRKTLSRRAPGRKYILCGHSLGSLVAIEYTRLYSNSVSHLILCSPPIYNLNKSKLHSVREEVLRKVSHTLQQNNNDSLEVKLMDKYYKSLRNVIPFTETELTAFLKTAKNSILFQTTYNDLLDLPDTSVDIIYGTFDAYMVPKNLSAIAKHRNDTKITTLSVGHEINKRYSKLIHKMLTQENDG